MNLDFIQKFNHALERIDNPIAIWVVGRDATIRVFDLNCPHDITLKYISYSKADLINIALDSGHVVQKSFIPLEYSHELDGPYGRFYFRGTDDEAILKMLQFGLTNAP